jgi:hypothetical protein
VSRSVAARRRREVVAARVAKLPRRILEQLKADRAPQHVTRWIAWGSTPDLRESRFALALSLRQPSQRGGRPWRWTSDFEKSAVDEVLLRWRPLGPDEIPRDVFQAAIAARYAAKGIRPFAHEAAVILARVAELDREREALFARLGLVALAA